MVYICPSCFPLIRTHVYYATMVCVPSFWFPMMYTHVLPYCYGLCSPIFVDIPTASALLWLYPSILFYIDIYARVLWSAPIHSDSCWYRSSVSALSWSISTHLVWIDIYTCMPCSVPILFVDIPSVSPLLWSISILIDLHRYIYAYLQVLLWSMSFHLDSCRYIMFLTLLWFNPI